MQKVYWILCGTIFVCGSGLCIISDELFHRTDSGEMPPQFGLSVAVALFGIFGFLSGVAFKAIKFLHDKKIR
ncbi:hypothetical protein [Type-D symbiont of Plautia stali]|uniref:hypothetical protein n=1 Tax=Type-D symbiont of Plautia stali TaxID=1560356 RepID=UPI00073FA342|nr:hypothetical protein [Type-D symbiont of Plautia stali]